MSDPDALSAVLAGMRDRAAAATCCECGGTTSSTLAVYTPCGRCQGEGTTTDVPPARFAAILDALRDELAGHVWQTYPLAGAATETLCRGCGDYVCHLRDALAPLLAGPVLTPEQAMGGTR